MVVAILNVIVGLLLAFGAAQEGLVGGVMAGRQESLLVGTIGTAVSLVLSISGIGLWRGWSHRRSLTLIACLFVAAFSVVITLPPYRYMGVLAALLGIGYPLVAAWYVGWGDRGHQEQREQGAPA